MMVQFRKICRGWIWEAMHLFRASILILILPSHIMPSMFSQALISHLLSRRGLWLSADDGGHGGGGKQYGMETSPGYCRFVWFMIKIARHSHSLLSCVVAPELTDKLSYHDRYVINSLDFQGWNVPLSQESDGLSYVMAFDLSGCMGIHARPPSHQDIRMAGIKPR